RFKKTRHRVYGGPDGRSACKPLVPDRVDGAAPGAADVFQHLPRQVQLGGVGMQIGKHQVAYDELVAGDQVFRDFAAGLQVDRCLQARIDDVDGLGDRHAAAFEVVVFHVQLGLQYGRLRAIEQKG